MTSGRYIHIDEVTALVDAGINGMVCNSSWERQIVRGHIYAIAHSRGQIGNTESKKLRAANRDCTAMFLIQWSFREREVRHIHFPAGIENLFPMLPIPWDEGVTYKVTRVQDSWLIEKESS